MGKIAVHSAAEKLPDVTGLRERAWLLATIELITVVDNEDYEEASRYRFVPSDCPGNGGHVLRPSCFSHRYVEVHFHESAGTIVFGWDSDAAFSSSDGFGLEQEWEGIFAQIPEGLRHCLWHGESDTHGPGFCSGNPGHISVVAWRLSTDTAWRTAEFAAAERRYPEYRDYAREILADLTELSPGTLARGFPEDSDETTPEKVAAIEHIMARRPLSEDIVRALNPERSLADMAEAAAAIGSAEDRRIHAPWTMDDAVASMPAKAREQWLSRVRPAARFRARRDGDGPVVWRMGGLPELPDDVQWPVWEGYGELTHLATLDCALVPRELDAGLPEDGTLVFFVYHPGFGFDWESSEYEWWSPGLHPRHYPSGPEGVDRRGGCAVLYVPASASVSRRRPACAPDLPDDGLAHRHLDAEGMVVDAVVPTWPEEALDRFEDLDPDPSDILDELNHQLGDFSHQVGGHPTWAQSPQWPDGTYGARYAGTGGQDWELLATFPWDGDGTMYWLIHRDDLAERRFDKAVVTFQC